MSANISALEPLFELGALASDTRSNLLDLILKYKGHLNTTIHLYSFRSAFSVFFKQITASPQEVQARERKVQEAESITKRKIAALDCLQHFIFRFNVNNPIDQINMYLLLDPNIILSHEEMAAIKSRRDLREEQTTEKTAGEIFLEDYLQIWGHYKTKFLDLTRSGNTLKTYHKNEKIALVGDPEVGCSSLVLRAHCGSYTQKYTSNDSSKGNSYVFQSTAGETTAFVWDMVRQSYSKTLSSYHGVKGVVLILVDLSKEDPKRSLEYWYNEVIEASPLATLFIVGTKSDVKKEGISEKAREFAREKKLTYFEISTQSGSGVKELMDVAASIACRVVPDDSEQALLISIFQKDNITEKDCERISDILSRHLELAQFHIDRLPLLHNAVKKNNLALVQSLLAIPSVDVNFQTQNINTALHLAVTAGYLDITKILIERGANISAEDRRKNTPLHLAATTSDANFALSLVKLLIEKGCNPNPINSDGDTPLHFAAERGHLDIVNALIRERVPLNDQNTHGDTPLHLAIRYRHLETAKALIDNGASLDCLNNRQQTVLEEAELGRFETIATAIKEARGIHIKPAL